MERRHARREPSTDEEKPRIPPQERRASDEVEEALGSGVSGKPRLSSGTTPTVEVDRYGDTAQKEEASSEPGGGEEGEQHATGPSEPEGGDQEQGTQPSSVIYIQGGEFIGSHIGASSITFQSQEIHHHHLAQPLVQLGIQHNVAYRLPAGPPLSLPHTSNAALLPSDQLVPSRLPGPLSGSGQGRESPIGDPATDANRNLRSTKIVRELNGTITTFRNLLGGTLSVSKRIEAVITSAEMEFQLGEVYVTFPQESFERETRVILMAEIDSSEWRGQFTGHTPTLYVHAPGLKKDLDVRLPTWSCAAVGCQTTSRLWHRPQGSSTWKPTRISKPFTDDPYFDLKWRDFSPIIWGSQPAGASSSSHHGTEIPDTGKRVAGAVYTSDQNDLTVAFHLDDRGSGNRSPAAEWVAEKIAKLAPSRSLRLTLKTLQASPGDTLGVKISCVPSTLGTAGGRGTFQTTVDQDFTRTGYDIHNTTITGNERRSQNIDVTCELSKSRNFIREDTFSYIWTPRKISFGKRRYAPVAPLPHVANVITVGDAMEDNSQVVAQHHLERNSRMFNVARRTRSKILGRLSSRRATANPAGPGTSGMSPPRRRRRAQDSSEDTDTTRMSPPRRRRRAQDSSEDTDTTHETEVESSD